MKTRKQTFYLFSFILIGTMLSTNSCKDGDESPDTATIPSVVTSDITEITISTAISGGEITSDGGEIIIARGVCWSTNENPTIDDKKTLDGTGIGAFVSTIGDLATKTEYYVRAYATNSIGTAYGETKMFTTAGVVDIDGNEYTTVTIGSQTWMVENLKTTKYNDGTAISNPISDEEWANNNTGAYGWYNNNEEGYKDPYGALYNWVAVNSNKLCPTGWRVPTETDWETLIDFLGFPDAGSKLKEMGTAHWNEPNSDATNESGFTAVGSGHRWHTGAYAGLGAVCYFWSSTENAEEGTAYAYYVGPTFPRLEEGSYNKVIRGLSVRCIKE